MQYKGIKSKVLIEQILWDGNIMPEDFEVYCFNGSPLLYRRIYNNIEKLVSVYDKDFNFVNYKFLDQDVLVNIPFSDILKQTIDISKILSQKFKFVRVDWLLYKDKLYFNELTFTPFSGFFKTKNSKYISNLGNFIDLER